MYDTISFNISGNYFIKFFKFKKIKLRYNFGKITITQTHILNYTITGNDTHNDTHTLWFIQIHTITHIQWHIDTHNDKYRTHIQTHNGTYTQ